MHSLVSRVWALIGALCLVLLGGGVALGAAPGLLVPDPAVDGYRSADGTVTLDVLVSNPAKSMSVVSVSIGGQGCTATGTPVLGPRSSAKVSFAVEGCAVSTGPTTAAITGTLVTSTGAQSETEPVPLELTVKDVDAQDWSALWWFLFGFAALAAVVPPYLTWLAFPTGNAEKRARFRWEDLKAIVRMIWSKELIDHLDDDLPGISSDWNFKDNWASNVGLAASVFTGVFAAAGPLGELVGPGAKATFAVVAIASAIAAALIASGPLWLAILKQRTAQNHGYARHNTVAGVLTAAFVVYFATIGLIATVAHQARTSAPEPLLLILAAGALLLLVLYAWKSIPQTLGLGALPPGPEKVWVVEVGQEASQAFVIRRMELVPKGEKGVGVDAGALAIGLRPASRDEGTVSAMP